MEHQPNTDGIAGYGSIDEIVDRACRLMKMARQMGEAFESRNAPRSVEDVKKISEFRKLFDPYYALVLELFPLIESKSPELAVLRPALIRATQAARLLRPIFNGQIRDGDVVGMYSEMNSVSYDLWHAIEDLEKARLTKDPFESLDKLAEVVDSPPNLLGSQPQVAPSQITHEAIPERADSTAATELGTDRQSDLTSDDAECLGSKLTVHSWSELAIGIDQKRNFYAFVPAPSDGEIVRKREGVLLKLPGDRWPSLLEILSRSRDGRVAAVSELVLAVGPVDLRRQLPRDARARQNEIEDAHKEELMGQMNLALNWAKNVVTDLSRELRSQVDGPLGRGQTALSIDGESVTTGFITRCLIADDNRSIRFGHASHDPR